MYTIKQMGYSLINIIRSKKGHFNLRYKTMQALQTLWLLWKVIPNKNFILKNLVQMLIKFVFASCLKHTF